MNILMDTKNIPDQCQDCFNNRGGRCIALRNFQTEDCFARTVEVETFDRRTKEIVQYEKDFATVKRNRAVLEAVKQELLEAVEDETPQDRLNAISSSEIEACWQKDMRRGNGKGGSSEKEKAPHKKKQGNKIYIAKWDGFDYLKKY